MFQFERKPIMPDHYDVIIIGAGAAGLMCAITAGKRGKRVLLLERNKKPGAKILISGGGRCNFTNQDIVPTAYISENPHFAKSALSRYTPWDFMDLLARHGISWHEKTLGQLFCDQGAKAILKVLLDECSAAGVELRLEVEIDGVEGSDDGYLIRGKDDFSAKQLVIASGGLSIPQMGATDFGYKVARQFGLKIIEPRPALVPLIFEPEIVERMKELAGVAADSRVSVLEDKTAPSFRENLLFTHRGLSGPAILQISSYWQSGGAITIDLAPDQAAVSAWLRQQRTDSPKASIGAILSGWLPARLANQIAGSFPGNMASLSNSAIDALTGRLTNWTLAPKGTEGFKKAEVTRGGVSTAELSSKTMESNKASGLYFIGECVDVTGWLGGYNFQWAWASGHAAGNAV